VTTGRPSKFTPEARDRILQSVAMGVPLELAPLAARVSYSAFRSWMRQGEREADGEYRAFHDAVKEAEVRALTRWLAIIEKAAAAGNWTAAAWKVARRYPKYFGPQPPGGIQVHQYTSVTTTHRETHIRISEHLADPEVRDALCKLAERVAARGGFGPDGMSLSDSEARHLLAKMGEHLLSRYTALPESSPEKDAGPSDGDMEP